MVVAPPGDDGRGAGSTRLTANIVLVTCIDLYILALLHLWPINLYIVFFINVETPKSLFLRSQSRISGQ